MFTKRLHVLIIAALILVIAPAARPARAAASDETRSYYIGTLGKTAVQMELVIEMGSGSISGTYYYEKIGRPLELQGNIRAGEKITLDDRAGQRGLFSRRAGIRRAARARSIPRRVIGNGSSAISIPPLCAC